MRETRRSYVQPYILWVIEKRNEILSKAWMSIKKKKDVKIDSSLLETDINPMITNMGSFRLFLPEGKALVYPY